MTKRAAFLAGAALALLAAGHTGAHAQDAYWRGGWHAGPAGEEFREWRGDGGWSRGDADGEERFARRWDRPGRARLRGDPREEEPYGAGLAAPRGFYAVPEAIVVPQPMLVAPPLLAYAAPVPLRRAVAPGIARRAAVRRVHAAAPPRCPCVCAAPPTPAA